MTPNIGQVTLQSGDASARAALSTKARWAFDGDRDLVGILEMHASIIDLDDHSPAQGPFGPRQLRQLADRVGGALTLAELPGPPAGTIY